MKIDEGQRLQTSLPSSLSSHIMSIFWLLQKSFNLREGRWVGVKSPNFTPIRRGQRLRVPLFSSLNLLLYENVDKSKQRLWASLPSSRITSTFQLSKKPYPLGRSISWETVSEFHSHMRRTESKGSESQFFMIKTPILQKGQWVGRGAKALIITPLVAYDERLLLLRKYHPSRGS